MRTIKIILSLCMFTLLLTSCGKKQKDNILPISTSDPVIAEDELVEAVSQDYVYNESEAAETDIMPETISQELIINLTPRQYTYEDFIYDIDQIQKLYGSITETVKLCDTADGREVYDIIIGDPHGENQILIFGAMHAREYITAQVVMRQLCGCIDAVNGYGGEYDGMPVKEILDGITIHFVPMSNPDGVTISQLGPDGLNSDEVRAYVQSIGGGDYEQWKANANGVDLNRNFDAGWDEFIGSGVPSSDRYKGTFPGSEPEAAALINITENYHFKRTISYHTCGALIYWYYKQEGSVLEESQSFARRISKETGYPLDVDYTAVDAAGFKDWAVYKMGVPSLTIEVGNENGGGIINPVPISCFDNIWERNRNVVYATAYNLKYYD